MGNFILFFPIGIATVCFAEDSNEYMREGWGWGNHAI